MKRLLSVFLLLLWAVALRPNEAQFFGSGRLPSSLIVALVQDADGLIWVGTEQGLCSFDGYRFTSHRLPSQDMSPGYNCVSSLLAEDSGRLWVGTASGLLLRDRVEGNFRPVSFPDGIHPRVSSVVRMRDGRLVAGTVGYGLYRIDLEKLEASRLRGYAPQDDDEYFGAFYEASDGSVWKSGSSGQVWHRTKKGTIEHREGHAEAFYELDGQVELVGLPQTCVTQDAWGNTYIGTRGQGLQWIPRGEKTLRPLEVDVEGFDLSMARISSLLVDRDGNLWVGCHGRGLLQLSLHDKPCFQRWRFSSQGIRTGTCISSIAEGPGETLWCAVQGAGVYVFDSSGRVVDHPAMPAGVESLLGDGSGNLWVGTGDGLYRYDTATGRSQCLFSSDGYLVNMIFDMGGLLAVSAYGDGCYLVDKATGTIDRRLNMHSTDTLHRGRLCNNWIYDFDKDDRGRLWIGTASGISCYDPRTASFRTEGWEILHDWVPCTALCVRKNNQMAFASQLAMEGDVTFMTEDAGGDLWIASTDGLYRMQKGDSLVGTPLLREEFVQGAGLLLADGQICLGMADGLFLFHPDSVKARQRTAARVHLTAFRIGGEEVTSQTFSGRRRVMNGALMDCRKFSLAYSETAFQMDFSLLDFSDAQATVFQYRMADDDRWMQAPEGQNTITFNHLAPGHYHLQVRASVAGVQTPVEDYFIEIRAPWWLSTLAYVIYVLVFLLVVLMAAFVYNRHLQHQTDREKLQVLMSAIHAEDTPLTLDEMRKAIGGYVQNRKRQHGIYGDTAAVATRIDAPNVRSEDELLMDRVVQSVNRHLSDSEYTTEQLCQEVGVSRAQLHRKMKELTGLAASDFVRGIRLEQAARLLREHKMGIAQVAYSVGFATAGHFSTVFKKHFGVSPSQYAPEHSAAPSALV